MTVDNSATAWTLALMRNGADPELIAAYMATELSQDPLAYRALMTDREIAVVTMRQLGQKLHDLAPAFRAVGAVAARVNTAFVQIATGQPTGMPPAVEARITNAFKEAHHARRAH